MFATLLVVARESSWARHQSTSSRDLLAREEACQGAPGGMGRLVKMVVLMMTMTTIMMMIMTTMMLMRINTRVQPLPSRPSLLTELEQVCPHLTEALELGWDILDRLAGD